MPETFTEQSNFITHEMLAHPALFTHPRAQNVAIIDNQDNGILQEVLKHPHITEVWQITDKKPGTYQNTGARTQFYFGSSTEWATHAKPESFDILITTNSSEQSQMMQHYLKILKKDGILIQPCQSPFNTTELKSAYQQLLAIGFDDIQILNFPQPNYPSGWRTVLMTIKQGTFKCVSEKNIFNKPFHTRYYNLDMHKASLALPEFIKEQIFT